MPEEGTGTEEAQEGAGDVLEISDADFEAMLASDTPVMQDDAATASEGGQESGTSSDDVGQTVADAVKTGMTDVLDAVKAASVNGAPRQAPADSMKALEDHVTSQIQQSQGLNEDGARFMTQSVMAGIRPVIQAFQRQVQGLQGTINEIRTESAVSGIDTQINGWLDGHQITDEADRADIVELAKMRASRSKGENATMADVRSEVTALANRYVKASVATENGTTQEVVTRAGETPPPGGEGLSGQDDLVAKVLASTDPRDRIGGDRFGRLVEHFIKGGGQ